MNSLLCIDMQSREAAQTFSIVGVHHHRKKNYDSALFYFQKALIASSSSFNSTNVWDKPIRGKYRISDIMLVRSLGKKASAMKEKFSLTGKIDYLNQSLFCLRLAEKLVSKERNTLDLESSKWEFLEQNYDLYENIVSNLDAGQERLPNDTLDAAGFSIF